MRPPESLELTALRGRLSSLESLMRTSQATTEALSNQREQDLLALGELRSRRGDLLAEGAPAEEVATASAEIEEHQESLELTADQLVGLERKLEKLPAEITAVREALGDAMLLHLQGWERDWARRYNEAAPGMAALLFELREIVLRRSRDLTPPLLTRLDPSEKH
ncbi:MAG: hypothetical protein HY900_06970 [Deltaproteobacteria bacterium]|nr:hypothetical protein [Deltaproteobacteria bacterium]